MFEGAGSWMPCWQRSGPDRQSGLECGSASLPLLFLVCVSLFGLNWTKPGRNKTTKQKRQRIAALQTRPAKQKRRFSPHSRSDSIEKSPPGSRSDLY
jgi:hypothetical protein